MGDRVPSAGGRRRAVADAGALTLGTMTAGVTAYVFVIVGTRDLGAAGFAPVSVLWTLWSITAAVLTFPVQHWLIRTLRLPDGEGVLAGVRAQLVLAVVGVSGVVGLAGASVAERLFGVGGLLFPVLAGLVPLGSLAMGVSRGVLAGRERFGSVGLAIASENALRVLLALLLVATATGTPARYGIALVAGFATAAIWPHALRPAPGASPRRPADGQVRLLAEIVGGSALAQVVLTGAPLVVALLDGDEATTTSVFAALALFRAPYIVAAGLAARATGTITELAAAGRSDRLRRLRLACVGSAVLLVGPVALLCAAAGPSALRLVFGPDVALPGTLLAMIGAGTVLALGALAMTVLLIGRGLGMDVTAAWTAALVASGLTVVLSAGQPPAWRALASFVAAEAVALTTMAVQDVRRRGDPTAATGRAAPRGGR